MPCKQKNTIIFLAGRGFLWEKFFVFDKIIDNDDIEDEHRHPQDRKTVNHFIDFEGDEQTDRDHGQIFSPPFPFVQAVGLNQTRYPVEDQSDRDLDQERGLCHSDLAEQKIDVVIVHVQIKNIGQLL